MSMRRKLEDLDKLEKSLHLHTLDQLCEKVKKLIPKYRELINEKMMEQD